MTAIRPRTLTRPVRYAAAAVVLAAALVVMYSGAPATSFAGLTANALLVTVLLMFSISLWMNTGYWPRLDGRFLVVTGAAGRQLVDLSSLTRVTYLGERGGYVGLRLADADNALSFSIRRTGEVSEAVAQAVADAGRRGVPVPRRASVALGLEPVPGAPSRGFRPVVVHGLAFMAVFVPGLLLVVVLWNI